MLITNQKCIVCALFTTFIILSAVNIAWALPVDERTQQVQDAIVAAVDGVNAAVDVTDTHLAAITTLNLRSKGITELKTGDFEGLSALTDLNLYGNQLSSLPDGIFSGLTALTTLRLGNNTVDPMSITVSLEKVADGQFKAVAPTGAPFAIVLPISAMNGSIAGDATTVTISQGSVESSALTITRTEGTTATVTVDIGTLPGLPSNHYGYTVSKSDTESLEVIGEVVSTEPDPTPPEIDPTPPEIDPTPPEIDPEPEPPANSAPEFSDGTMAVRAVAENTDAGINIGSVVAATDTDSDDTLTYTLSGVDADSFDIDATTGQLKTKASLDYETKHVYAVTITVSDGDLSDTITVFINIIDRADTTLVSTSVPVSDRTAAVRDAIVTAISGVSDAADVTATHLAAITALDLRAAGISSLKSGDFGGLTGLTNLNLYGNQMSSLPAGIFEGLTSLTTLRLGGNVVAPMPLIVSLQQVDANQYQAIIPAGAPFDVTLSIDAMMVTIPQGSVKSDAFTATGVPVIGALPMLPVNHFGYTLAKSAVCSRTSEVAEAIAAAVPGVTDCHNVSEIDLAAITELDLSNKSITSLQADDFAGMLSLTTLDLRNNQLSSLPDGIFAGMTTLTSLQLEGNTADPFSLTIALLKVGENQFKAVLSTGAPFAITLPVLVKTGNIVSSAMMVTIPQGSVESEVQTITRTTGTFAAVSVDIGTLPSLPAMHSGYALAKSDDLPLEILESINVAPVFTDGSTTTRSIAENTDAGVNIGSAVAATDANNDILTYTLSGTDAAAFDIVSTTGQLQTKVALDFETKTSYSVTITVSDSILTDTIAVTINVTDKSELPSTDDAESETVTNNAPVFTDGESATRSVAENTGSGVDIGSPISATDDDDDTLEYSLGGINAGSFTIDTTTGQLRTRAALNFEAKSSYTVEITVSDNTDTATITVTINVTDVDEDPVNVVPVFSEGSSATRSVAENTGSGVDIGSTVSATDTNNDTLSYSLSGTNAAVFSIDSTTGQLRTSAALDFETKDFYSVTITVSDGKGGSATITVTINITNVDEALANNAPVFTEEDSTTRSIAENTGSGVDIGSAVSATDDDNDTLSYSLGGTDAAVFSIDSSSGQLRTSAALDFETKDTYSVTISVSDSNGGSDSITVTISVTNVDETPTNNDPVFTEDSSATRSVTENTGSGVDIGSAVSATDADNDTLTYRLEGADASSFSIDSSSGQLQTSATLDYESKLSYSVIVTVSDENGGSDSINVTISVTNVNESPEFTDGTSTARSIAENAPAGTNIGNAVAATDDDGDTLTYTLGGDPDAASFDIETTTGQLKTKASLDFETDSSYTVTVAVSDSKGGTDSITVTITVTDLDETPSNNPPVFTAGDDPITRAVAENLPAGTGVGNAVAATDADENTLAYLLSGDDASAFSIDGDGQLKTSAPLNHEVKSSYTVTITVSDGSLTDTINVTISVTDANDAPVFNKELPTTLSIAENVEAANIGDAFTATDEDGDTLTYSLQTLTDVTPFRIDTASGQLQTLRPLNFEEETSYTVTIAVEDDDGGSDEIVVTITITDVDENIAPVFTDGDSTTTRSIAENTGSGVNIGNPVAATDADEDNLEYTLGGTNADAFDIGSTTGQLRTKAPLNYETKDSYEVTVTVSDGNGGSAEIEVAITITDVDENIAPVFTDGDRTTREVAENTGPGVNIGTPVSATDANNDTLTYSLGGTNAAAFEIGSTTGQLRTKSPLDFETKDEYSVTITVDDSNGGSDTITATITVTDVDENIAPVFTKSDGTTREVVENTASGVNIGNPVSATDANNDNLTYSLGGEDAASFSINTANGQLRTHAALDYETDDSYSVTITVDDNNGGSDSITVTISVTNENEAPMFTVGDRTTRSVAENTTSGENIGAPVSATDEDNNTLTYTLGGTNASSFSIVSGTGQLQTSAALDYETDDTYSVTITVSDGSLTDSISVTINITDINENRAPIYAQDSTERSIRVRDDTTNFDPVGDPVVAVDPDADTLTYTISGDDASFFNIVSSTGQLRVNTSVISDSKTSYSVTVTASDENGGSDSIVVTITVTRMNHEPEFTDDDSTTREVAENTASGMNIGAPVSATDEDNDTLTYSLGGTDASSFSIVSTTGQLQTSAALNYEAEDSYSVTITVRDEFGGSDEISVTINITDVNESASNNAPTFGADVVLFIRNIAIVVDTAVGDNIGDPVTATDADNDPLTYTISRSDASFFSIVSSTGQLQVTTALLNNNKLSYSITITASDNNGGSDSKRVSVRVDRSAQNHAPVFIEGESTVRRIPEDTNAGQNVGSPVTATDADDNTLIYTLGGDDASSFSIVSATGQLQTKATLDYDTDSSYTVTITATDVYSASDEITVTINITEVDDSLIPVCDRTPQVRDAIVATLSDIDDCNDVTSIHLTRITELILWHEGITSLKSGDFDGLSNLKTLRLDNNSLTSLPTDIFSGLSKLEELDISGNSLTTVPSDVFDGLYNLKMLDLQRNEAVGSNNFYYATLTSLSSGVFDDLTSLEVLDLGVNGLRSLPSEIFDGLSNLKKLDLAGSSFSSLSSDVFDGLTSLEWLFLNDSFRLGSLPSDVFDDLTSLKWLDLSRCIGMGSLPSGLFDSLTSLEMLDLNGCILRSLPSGIFSKLSSLKDLSLTSNLFNTLPNNIFVGLTSLEELSFWNNVGGSLLVHVSLKKVSDGEFKAAVDTGAPFNMVLSLTVTNGSINGGATTITIPKGKSESDETLTVTRSAGTAAAVKVHIGGLPRLPSKHQNYTLRRSGDGKVEVFGALATNSAPVFSDVDSVARTVVENTVAETNIGSPVAASDPNNDVLTYTLGGTNASSFSIVSTTGQLKTKAALDYETKNTYTVTITASDGNLTDSITVTINITDDPTDNAPPVFTDGVSTTRTVVENTVAETNIGSPVAATDVDNNILTYTLSGDPDAAAFDIDSTTGQLKTKATLDYETKDTYTVTITVSDGNDNTDEIEVTIKITNEIEYIPDTQIISVCERTPRIRGVIVAAVSDVTNCNDVTAVHLTAITEINLNWVNVGTLQEDDFSGMSSLESLSMDNSNLSSLPSDIFDGLSSLTNLSLSYNNLSDLPSDVFDGLSSLEYLRVEHNELGSLPAGIFKGLTSLKSLWLHDNQDDGILFTPSKIIDLPVSLEKVSEGQFKAVAPTGAPFEIVLPISVGNGAVTNSATSITINTGSVESAPLAVARTIGTTGAVTVNIGTLPGVPTTTFLSNLNHQGYTLIKSGSLPLEVIDAVVGAPQSTEDTIPAETALLANYPNPANPETWIPYQLAKPADVSLTIYNVRGVVVRRLTLGYQQAGVYMSRDRAAHWDGKNKSGESVASGVYFYVFKAGKYTALRKILIRK